MEPAPPNPSCPWIERLPRSSTPIPGVSIEHRKKSSYNEWKSHMKAPLIMHIPILDAPRSSTALFVKPNLSDSNEDYNLWVHELSRSFLWQPQCECISAQAEPQPGRSTQCQTYVLNKYEGEAIQSTTYQKTNSVCTTKENVWSNNQTEHNMKDGLSFQQMLQNFEQFSLTPRPQLRYYYPQFGYHHLNAPQNFNYFAEPWQNDFHPLVAEFHYLSHERFY